MGSKAEPPERYLCSFERWQISSTEKENANAKAMASHKLPSFLMAIIIMTKQNRLVTTVSAFFSDKYFLILVGFKDGLDFYEAQIYFKVLRFSGTHRPTGLFCRLNFC
jgi:hypothetical protein